MLSPFLLSAVQRRLSTTPAEVLIFLPSPAPSPTLTWPEDIVPRVCLTPLVLCVWWTWHYGRVWDWPDNCCWLSLFQEGFKGILHCRQFTRAAASGAWELRLLWHYYTHAKLTAMTAAAPLNVSSSQAAAWSERSLLSSRWTPPWMVIRAATLFVSWHLATWKLSVFAFWKYWLLSF